MLPLCLDIALMCVVDGLMLDEAYTVKFKALETFSIFIFELLVFEFVIRPGDDVFV